MQIRKAQIEQELHLQMQKAQSDQRTIKYVLCSEDGGEERRERRRRKLGIE